MLSMTAWGGIAWLYFATMGKSTNPPSIQAVVMALQAASRMLLSDEGTGGRPGIGVEVGDIVTLGLDERLTDG